MMSKPEEKPHALRGDEFAHLIEAVEDYAIFLLSPAGEIRSWNRGAARIMGYSEREVLGRHFSMFYGPGELAARKPEQELVVAQRDGRVEDEGWRLRKDGTRFWANTVITVLRDPNGVVTGFAKVTRDMSERRQAEEKLRESTEIFQLLVSSVGEYAIFMLDPEGRVATWNAGAQKIKGYKPDEIIGRHFSTFYPEEDIRSGKPERELEIARAEGSVEDAGWRLRKDGTLFWANVVITAVYDRHGQLRGFAKVTRDMTERRAADEKMRQNMETFQLLVSSVRDYAIFMLDPDGRIATWNNGAQNIKGYKPDEIIGQHFSVFYPEEDIQNRKPERELEIARAEGSVEDEGWRIRKDGTRFWANVLITAVYDEHRTLRGFAKVTRDITDRRNGEENARALLEQRTARLHAEEERSRAEASYRVAQEANRAKDEFLMTLSHELRTPMTAIVGWARLLPALSPADPIFREAINAIANGAQLQARLIDDILDVSRIMSGKLRLNPETVDLAQLVTAAVEAVIPTAASKQIIITKSFAADLGTIVADPTRLQQVVWNLVSNAVKFTPKGGTVDVSAQGTASQVQISVRDNGEGIDPEFIPHVFEAFRQAENPQTRVHGGLGLGLSIVRYIAEAHGGTAMAASEGRGKGATFTVTLPVHAISTHADAENESDTRVQRGRLRGVEVVVVDDDAESRKMIAAALRSVGASVVALDSAYSALDAIDGQRPDLVITDIAMPEVDGYSFLRSLRERPYGEDVKVIALTALPAPSEGPHGFDAYLSKPIDPFELVEEIARLTLPTRTY